MQFHFMALAFVLAAIADVAGAQPATPPPQTMTLAEAMRLAESAQPLVLAREAQFAAAEGARREAEAALFNNPTFGTEAIRRRAGAPVGSAWNEWSLGISQPFETGGQQARRREAAAAGVDAVRAEVDDARRQARLDAATRFVAVLSAQQRVQLEQRSVELYARSAQAVATRRAAGEDTRLDANVALVEVERARNALALASERLLDARSDLGMVLRLPPAALPDAAGELDAVAGPLPYALAQLLASAQAVPRQRALAAREDAARARLGVERASRNPDVTLGVHVGRDGPSDATERLAIVSLSVPLPLFKRNDAAIGQATTELTQAEIERAATLRDTEVRVRQLWSRLASQRERVQRLQRLLLPAAGDNQRLSARSREAGQIGLLDQLIVNRQAIDAERELIDLLAEMHLTRIELEHAAGWPLEGSSR